MTIWRDFLIETNVGDQALSSSVADALGVDAAEVAIVAGGSGKWPVKPCEIVAETWPACGESRLMAAVFVFRDPPAIEQINDRSVAQALADGLDCAVLLGDEADTNPFNFLRFRSKAPMERVSLDPYGLDQRPMCVSVIGINPSPAEAAQP